MPTLSNTTIRAPALFDGFGEHGRAARCQGPDPFDFPGNASGVASADPSCANNKDRAQIHDMTCDVPSNH